MEIDLPYGIETAIRAVEKSQPKIRVEMTVVGGSVHRVELGLSAKPSRPEPGARSAEDILRAAGFRPEADNRMIWDRYAEPRRRG